MSRHKAWSILRSPYTLAVGVVLSHWDQWWNSPGMGSAGGTAPPAAAHGLCQTSFPSLTTSPSSQDLPGLRIAGLSLGVFKPAPGQQRRPGLAAWVGPPLLPHPPALPSPPPPGRVSRAWHGGPICFQSGPVLPAPSPGLWLGWGPCLSVPVRPPLDSRPREASVPAPLPRPVGFCGLCLPTQTGRGFSAPPSTSCIWVCLGRPL